MALEIIRVLILALLILCIPAGALAETTTIPNVKTYDVSVTEGMVVSQITIDTVPIGCNQTHTMYSGGRYLVLTVNSAKDSFVGVNYHSTFELSLSNGSYTQQITMDKYGTHNDYKLYIQMLDPLEGGALPNLLAVNLYVGLNPLVGRFDLPPYFGSYTEVPMTRATGTIDDYTTVYVTQDSFEDWQKITSGDITHYVGEALGLVWESILALIEMIPFIGPHFSVLLEYSGTLLTSGLYWVGYFLLNLVGIFIGLQALIMAIAATEADFELGKTMRLIAQHNGSLFSLGLNVFRFLHGLVMRTLIAVGALK